MVVAVGKLVRSLTFPLAAGDAERLRWVMTEYRLMVNKAPRVAVGDDIRSRDRLQQVAYEYFRQEHRVYSQLIPSAFAVALAHLKNYRRRLRKGQATTTPYTKRLFVKYENQSIRLNRDTGTLRVPIRAREYVTIQLPLSQYHRVFLNDKAWGIGRLCPATADGAGPGRVVSFRLMPRGGWAVSCAIARTPGSGP